MTAATTVRTPLLILAYLAFISLGLPDGLLGVGWPSIAPDFKVSTEAVGILLIAGTTGYLTSSVAAGFALARLGVGRLLAGSTALTCVAMAGYAASPSLAMMAPCALVLGFGGGAIDSGLNAYAAGAFGPRHMNWMHACFGLGVAFGPLIMTAALGADLSWRWGYGIVATGQLLLALAFTATWSSWSAHRPVDVEASTVTPVTVRSRDTLVLPAVWYGVVAFGVYVAIEIGAGLWAFLLLTGSRGMSDPVAGVCVSAYWAMLFLGRVVQGVVAERIGSHQVLVASLVGMATGSLLIAIPAPAWLAVVGLCLIGFAAAPVFPLLTLTTADRVGIAHADRTIGLQMAGAGLGGALLPAGIGVLIGRTDIEALGPSLVVLSLFLLGLYVVANRRRTPEREPAEAMPG